MELLRGRAPGRRAEPGAEAESWFLERGLPFVLTRRARWRRLWTRSSPMLAAYAALQACILAVYLITGGHDIEISGEPTTSELAVLILLALALPLMAVVGWLVSQSRRRKTRTAIATLSVLARGERRGHHRRPHAGGRRRRRRADPDRQWNRLGARVGRTDDAVAPCDGGRLGRPGLAGRAADRVGVLQHLCLADGRDHQRQPPGAGHGVPGLHRGGVRHLGHPRARQADVAIGDGAARRTRKACGHTVRTRCPVPPTGRR